ncbi:hypothetical protein JCM12294_35450 [Desulfocicer niacini]
MSAALESMVVQLGKHTGIKFMNRIREPLQILDNASTLKFNHAFPGAVIGMDSKFSYDNQSASPLGTSPVISDMTVV